MIKLTDHDLKVWADEQNLPDPLFAELDYRLVKTLEAIYNDPYLSKRLCMKGGTAINKLYLLETSRLSVDLDFNHIGPKEEVLKERPEIRLKLTELLTKLDSSYEIHSEHRYELTRIKTRYKTVNGTTANFKIEISHVERFPIISPVEKPIQTPTGAANILTYTLEELTATKIRALLERSKGRDIYDLYFISKLNPNPTITRKMFLYYFYRSRKVFNPKIHYKSLTAKYSGKNINDDVSPFVKPAVVFNLKKAAKDVIKQYVFITQFDQPDRDFLNLAGLLLGKNIPKKGKERVENVDKPLKLLFDELKISKEASEITSEEIKIYRR
jgi:predicted nucleotidyltransferase component of viral defense system